MEEGRREEVEGGRGEGIFKADAVHEEDSERDKVRRRKEGYSMRFAGVAPGRQTHCIRTRKRRRRKRRTKRFIDYQRGMKKVGSTTP